MDHCCSDWRPRGRSDRHSSRRAHQSLVWLVAAATCCFALGYRFYSSFIAAKVLAIGCCADATPSPERLENGRDFLVTNKWVVFGHHFAAIAGPGPLVGPVLAAQFGYLPGTLWDPLVGAVFAGCVQDFVILLFSVRRDGKSLTEMAKEANRSSRRIRRSRRRDRDPHYSARCRGSGCRQCAQGQPCGGTFTIAMTIPIALLMGVYLRQIRPARFLGISPGIHPRHARDPGRASGRHREPLRSLTPSLSRPQPWRC